MSDPFASPRNKLAWAKEHLFPDLHQRIEGWMSLDPYAKIIEPDTKPGWEVHKLKLVKPLPPEIINLVGDMLGNLREVLDNAGYAIAIAANSPNTGCTAFPFASDVEHMVSSIGRAKDLPPQIQSLFCGFQPYRGGNDLLWALNQLCNAKKHKYGVTPMATVMWPGRAFAEGKGRPFEVPLRHVWDSTKDEMVVFKLGPIVVPDATWDYDFNFLPFVAIQEIEVVEGKPVLSVLHALCCQVESILMAIEAECARLGIIK
jgi:hypothetical protein